MKERPITCKALFEKATIGLVTVSATLAPALAAETETGTTARIASSDTMVLKARDFKVENGSGSGDKRHRVVFVLDGEAMSLRERFKFLSDGITKTAIIGHSRPTDGVCPYLDISNRSYDIEQIEAGRMVFRVSSAATQAEIDRVRTAGCVVTPKPNVSKIRWM